MRKTVIALCAAVLAAPLGLTAAPANAQGVEFRVGPGGPSVGFYTDGPYGYYGGYRGYRHERPGWRQHRGYWFPPDAFVERRVYRPRHSAGRAHVDWCSERYRSYRAYDNTYSPRRGVRAQCVSPYS